MEKCGLFTLVAVIAEKVQATQLLHQYRIVMRNHICQFQRYSLWVPMTTETAQNMAHMSC